MRSHRIRRDLVGDGYTAQRENRRKVVFFFKQKTAYEMSVSDWSSDVCSSDLLIGPHDLAGIGVERELRGRVDVRVLAVLARVGTPRVPAPRPGVARPPVQEVELGIVRADVPGRPASRLPRVVLPRVVARLARPGDRE